MKPSDNSKEQLEKELANALTSGDMANNQEPSRAAKAAQSGLSPRYEARAQVERDPIVEETKIVRTFVREIDSRYDDYLERTKRNDR